jgi:predicted TIM-barrel fold metal-dependent hydrolase
MTQEYLSALSAFIGAQERLFRVKLEAMPIAKMAEDFRREDIRAMVIAWDAQTAVGGGTISNDWVAKLSVDHPDVFLPGWAMVDPWKGDLALAELERAISKLGLLGAKWHPPIQAFELNDRRFSPIWDLCQSLGAPILVHTGMTGVGQGMPGGGGIKNRYGRPYPYLDDVAADFPNLTIVAAHSGFPWAEELISIALHKPNVFIEVSGYRPRYLPAPLKHEISRRLQDKVMFGSDYPALSPWQCLDELQMEGFRPEIIEKLFWRNAASALKLGDKLGQHAAINA